MPIETALLKTAGSAGLKLLRHLEDRNTASFQRARDEMFREWVAELSTALQYIYEQLRLRHEHLDSKLEQVLQDGQLVRLYDNFGYEAAREAIDERRRMLAYAAAGIVDPELTVEQKARVERTLRELDPVDVRMLYGLDLLPARILAPDIHDALRKRDLAAPSADVLLASGCVRIDVHETMDIDDTRGVGHSAAITPLGKNVLQVLRAYLQLRGPAFEVPGRETLPGERSEAAARSTLASHPGLLDLLYWALNPTRDVQRTYRFRKPSSERGELTLTIPRAEESWVWLHVLSDCLRGSELRLTVARGWSESMLLLTAAVTLEGPHDILRVAADIVDAPWRS